MLNCNSQGKRTQGAHFMDVSSSKKFHSLCPCENTSFPPSCVPPVLDGFSILMHTSIIICINHILYYIDNVFECSCML